MHVPTQTLAHCAASRYLAERRGRTRRRGKRSSQVRSPVPARLKESEGAAPAELVIFQKRRREDAHSTGMAKAAAATLLTHRQRFTTSRWPGPPELKGDGANGSRTHGPMSLGAHAPRATGKCAAGAAATLSVRSCLQPKSTVLVVPLGRPPRNPRVEPRAENGKRLREKHAEPPEKAHLAGGRAWRPVREQGSQGAAAALYHGRLRRRTAVKRLYHGNQAVVARRKRVAAGRRKLNGQFRPKASHEEVVGGFAQRAGHGGRVPLGQRVSFGAR